MKVSLPDRHTSTIIYPNRIGTKNERLPNLFEGSRIDALSYIALAKDGSFKCSWRVREVHHNNCELPAIGSTGYSISAMDWLAFINSRFIYSLRVVGSMVKANLKLVQLVKCGSFLIMSEKEQRDYLYNCVLFPPTRQLRVKNIGLIVFIGCRNEFHTWDELAAKINAKGDTIS